MFPIMNFHLCTIVVSLSYKIKRGICCDLAIYDKAELNLSHSFMVFYMRWHIDVQEVTDSCVKSYV